MTPSLTRRLSLALPILFYLMSLLALRLHLASDDTPLGVVALLSAVAALITGGALVAHQRSVLLRVSSDA